MYMCCPSVNPIQCKITANDYCKNSDNYYQYPPLLSLLTVYSGSSTGSLFNSLASKYCVFWCPSSYAPNGSSRRSGLVHDEERRRGEAECLEDARRFLCRMKKIASTVRQTTLMPPTTPPMMGPRGMDSLGVRLDSASLVAAAIDGE
jgi:hypothetical protein